MTLQLLKNIRKLREGGIGLFITSSGTLDNSQKLRNWIVNEGNSDVIGAFRMNNETFQGTSVTSDIIVARKRVKGQISPNAIDVSTISSERVVPYNTGETKKVKNDIEQLDDMKTVRSFTLNDIRNEQINIQPINNEKQNARNKKIEDSCYSRSMNEQKSRDKDEKDEINNR